MKWGYVEYLLEITCVKKKKEKKLPVCNKCQNISEAVLSGESERGPAQ